MPTYSAARKKRAKVGRDFEPDAQVGLFRKSKSGRGGNSSSAISLVGVLPYTSSIDKKTLRRMVEKALAKI